MDSYASHPYGGTDTSSNTDIEEHPRVASPQPMDKEDCKEGSPEGTERAESTHSKKLAALDTEASADEKDEDNDDVVLCDSPTSEA